MEVIAFRRLSLKALMEECPNLGPVDSMGQWGYVNAYIYESMNTMLAGKYFSVNRLDVAM